MKEQFRTKIPKGRIRIKYDDNGIPNYWETTAEILFQQVDDVVTSYMEMGIKLTNRQLYYQLVGKDLIPNKDEVYKRICVFLTDTRYGGMIDWEAIEDKDRIPEKHPEWDNIKSIISSAVAQYRLPRWKDQYYYVEMYCEKKAGINVLQPIADKYHMYFGFNKGYSSASAMYDLADRIRNKLQNHKHCIILYFGDHDASGLDMIRDIRTRIREFLLKSDYRSLDKEDIVDKLFDVIPVALTMEQIKKYNPPANPAKITDPRAKWYIKKFGKVSWELDSLDALELRNIAEQSVLEYLDLDKYNAHITRETEQKKALEEFGDTLTDNNEGD